MQINDINSTSNVMPRNYIEISVFNGIQPNTDAAHTSKLEWYKHYCGYKQVY